MSIGSATSAPGLQAPGLQTLASPQSRPTAGVDRDGDNDNDATESAAMQARESSAPSLSLPTDPNRGRTLNISA
ncbi:hypothetical protein [Azospirillum sp. TSO35-2]|uniref:hypothetical protein n=1 Tax=Azospirillum sp. TSO35-2 TaxID=716796 RepID=UPI000D62105C|nr:hypothetical protein [Azospirillum sp. TSO35-2]PWC33419.1 hypothetical protein TSO352_23420 [Azospirillum sp. TSO35-2]